MGRFMANNQGIWQMTYTLRQLKLARHIVTGAVLGKSVRLAPPGLLTFIQNVILDAAVIIGQK
ncbi:hypothetical protein ACU8KH_04404 [Lachancea thermotolerans]